MIRSFADRDTERLFGRDSVGRFRSFERVALRKLVLLHSATMLGELRGTGLSLEALKREHTGQHAIRINSKWRLCFVWRDGEAHDVEITD